MDLIPHTSHFPLLTKFFKLLEASNRNRNKNKNRNSQFNKPIIIRLQDPGLSLFIRKVFPLAALHLTTETGNMNYRGIQHYLSEPGGSFNQVTFNNELPISEMKNIINNTPSNIKFELQVHGPLLIQYTQRNLLTMKFNNLKQCLIEEISRPGHFFPMLDNNHGTFLYYRADKNLLWFIPELLDLKLTYWLIDGRGQSKDYLTKAIKYYQQQMVECLNQLDQKNKKKWRPSKEVLNSLSQTSSRPFIRGFFLANNSDRSLRFKQRPFEKRKLSNIPIVGKILDVKRPKWLIVEAITTLKIGEYSLIDTNNQVQTIEINEILSIHNEPIAEAQPGELIKIPWYKGITPQSILTLKS